MKFLSLSTLCSLLAAGAVAQPTRGTLVWKRLGAANDTAAANTTAVCEGAGAANAAVGSTAATNATAGGETAVAANVTAGTAATAGNAATAALVLPDGRIKQDAVPADFNVLASVFKSAVVKGDGLQFSDLVVFPNVPASMFDQATNTKAFEITINDSSIFVPQGGTPQTNVRRADLLPSIRSQLNNVATTGVRTMHLSVQQDPARPINTTHDYQVFNLESADFAFHQLDIRTGADNAGKLAIQGNSNNPAGQQTLATVDFPADQMVNLALKMDFDANTVEVFSSTGNTPLASVSAAVANDLAGNGEYHFALQKNPVGTADQPTGINEGMIFAGIFMEDSTNGQVTLQ